MDMRAIHSSAQLGCQPEVGVECFGRPLCAFCLVGRGLRKVDAEEVSEGKIRPSIAPLAKKAGFAGGHQPAASLNEATHGVDLFLGHGAKVGQHQR